MHEEFHVVQTNKYDGLERRQNPRVKTKVLAKLIHNDSEDWVTVINISHGGCRMVTNQKVNPQGTISLKFLHHLSEKEYKEMAPIHGRVIGVHKRHELYHTNIDFKGALFAEHGIDALYEEWANKQ